MRLRVDLSDVSGSFLPFAYGLRIHRALRNVSGVGPSVGLVNFDYG